MTLSMRTLLLLSLVACVPSKLADPFPDTGATNGDGGADAGLSQDASVVLLPGDGSSAEQAALSCEFIASEMPDAASGTYWLNPIGGGIEHAFRVFCDLESEDGPWTLVLKIDGTQTTFKYSSPLWINHDNHAPENPEPGPEETKNSGYSLLPFTAIRLGMRVPEEAEEGDGQTRYIKLQKSGESIRHLMVRGGEHRTELGPEVWRSLIPLTSMQANCNAEGVNIRHDLRFGLFANQEDDCNTPDSWIGIGSNHDQVIAGNFAVARWDSDNGDRRTKAFAEVWVQNNVQADGPSLP